MLDYAAMLFKNQEVNFTVLHVKSPCLKEGCRGKCSLVFDKKLKKNQQTLMNHGFDKERIQTLFIEGSFIESIRHVIVENKIDMIMLGNSSREVFETGLFFDKKTLEIITKVKCSVILIPEQARLKVPKTVLLPTDFSITSDYSIFNILTSLAFVKQAELSLLPTGLNKALGPNRRHAKALISEAVNSLEFKSVKEIKLSSKAAFINEFDLVMVMAKNLSIFQNLFSTSPASLYIPEVPILFLHDTRKL